MIHDLDIVQWLVGEDVEVTDVRAVGIPVLTNRVDAANARLEFATGAVANITASRIGTEKIRKMRFFQPHDYIAVDYATRYASISSLMPPQGGSARPGVNTRILEIEDVEPLRAEIELFIKQRRRVRLLLFPARMGGVRLRWRFARSNASTNTRLILISAFSARGCPWNESSGKGIDRINRIYMNKK